MLESIVALALAVGPTLEDARAAEQSAAAAVGLHSQGKLERASETLAQAYALYPDRDYLFMRAVIEREAGDCVTAMRLFRAFIDEHPPLVDVEAAQAQLDACAKTLETAQPAPEPEPVAEPVHAPEVGPATEVDRPRRPSRPWSRDPVGGTLVGSGVAFAVAGIGLVAGAAVRARSAEQADTTDEFRRNLDNARGLNAAGVTVLALGTSLIIGGVLRYTLLARKARRVAID